MSCICDEQIPLGGGRLRGLGVVKLEIDKMPWFDVNNDPEKLLTYLQELVSSNTPDDISSYKDGQDFKQDWIYALINHLRDNMNKSSTVEATQNY